jgi:hypothetical protein
MVTELHQVPAVLIVFENLPRVSTPSSTTGAFAIPAYVRDPSALLPIFLLVCVHYFATTGALLAFRHLLVTVRMRKLAYRLV